MKKYIWGVDVGGTTIKIGLFYSDGELISKYEIPTRTENEGKFILSDICDSITTNMSNHDIAKEDTIGVGLALPGPVDAIGVITGAVNLNWGVFNVVEEMERLIGIPVAAGNDANAAALGEMWQGASRGYLDSVMLTLGTGIGGGIVSGGEMLLGHKGSAGELGHIRVRDDETKRCSCGNFGCVEQYASATGVVNLAKEILENEPDVKSIIRKENLTAKDVFDGAKTGDELATKTVYKFGFYLGKAIGITVSILAPEVVVIGGGVSKAGNIILEALDKTYIESTFHACKDVPVVLATLGNDGGIYGAARMVLNKARD